MAKDLTDIDRLRVTQFRGPAALEHRLCIQLTNLDNESFTCLTLDEVKRLNFVLDVWIREQDWGSMKVIAILCPQCGEVKLYERGSMPDFLTCLQCLDFVIYTPGCVYTEVYF